MTTPSKREPTLLLTELYVLGQPGAGQSVERCLAFARGGEFFEARYWSQGNFFFLFPDEISKTSVGLELDFSYFALTKTTPSQSNCLPTARRVK